MTLRVFLLVISGMILIWSASVADEIKPAKAICHDDYLASSFEEADYDLADFLDEYFVDAGIPFLPTQKEASGMGLKDMDGRIYLRPGVYRTGGGKRKYPYKPGVWKITDLGNGVMEIHLLISEAQQMTEAQAFNTYNDLLGEAFADYDNQAYEMTMLPEDIRRSYKGRYFTLNLHIYGLRNDATALNHTVADVILTDYTRWVKENEECRKK